MFGLDNDVGLPAGEVVAGEVVAGEVVAGARNPSEDRDLLPDFLETTTAGTYLGAILASVDVGRLNGHDAVRFLMASPGWNRTTPPNG
ncbi:MAG: hypothetical protein WBM90_14650 [Acidimicrobiia bacterium]